MSGLDTYRERLDSLDEQILQLLGERFDVCREVAAHKGSQKIPVMQPQRVAEVRRRYAAGAAEVDLPPDFTTALFELLIEATCRVEDELIESITSTQESDVR